MESLIPYEDGIYALDAGYVRPLLAAIHLIVENDRVAFVDTGNSASLDVALDALDALGLSVDAVDYVILTHIHLDHAGGAGAMMAAFPKAKLVVHPRGARHMADPSKLLAGATAVYGAAEVRRLYGDVLPVEAARLVEITHEQVIDLAGRPLLCLDTPGHAKHHLCIVDRKSGCIFTGDTLGISYRELDTDGRQFIFPTTTPVQFDPVAMHASLDLLLSYQPQAAYLTHFSRLDDLPQKFADLHRLIDLHLSIALREKNTGEERHARIRAGLAHLLLDEAARFGCHLPPVEVLEVYQTDLELNAQGLGVWLDTQASGRG